MAALPGGTDVALTHKFVSGKADGADPTLVQPSKWNQNENLGAGADGQKVVRDSGQTDGASWVNYDTESRTNSTGGAAAVGDVVAVSIAADNAVVLDDTVSSLKKFVVALQTPANAAVGAYAYAGSIPGVKAQGAIAAGQYVRKSATTKAVEDAGIALGSANTPPAGTLGFATSAAAAGFVNVFWFLETVIGASSQVLYDELTGLAMSNSGANLSVAVGACASDDATIANRVAMSLTSALIGTTAATFVVGNNQPKLDAGAVGNNQTWHVFVIKRVDTGVVDILFSQSATAPTLPANYTKQRRIGAFLTDGAATIRTFTQDGDEFLHLSPLLDVNTTNPGTAAVTAALTVPSGVKLKAILNVFVDPTTSGTNAFFAYLSALDTTDLAPSTTASPLVSFKGAGGGNGFTGGDGPVQVRTNTSAQIRYRMGTASGAADVIRIATLGWIDRRGRG